MESQLPVAATKLVNVP